MKKILFIIFACTALFNALNACEGDTKASAAQQTDDVESFDSFRDSFDLCALVSIPQQNIDQEIIKELNKSKASQFVLTHFRQWYTDPETLVSSGITADLPLIYAVLNKAPLLAKTILDGVPAHRRKEYVNRTSCTGVKPLEARLYR